jgi:hypothetical protein
VKKTGHYLHLVVGGHDSPYYNWQIKWHLIYRLTTNMESRWRNSINISKALGPHQGARYCDHI